LKDLLPRGAAAFALQDGHFDMTSERSIKDLKLEDLRVVDAMAQLGVIANFAYNQLSDTPRLSITYEGVAQIAVDLAETVYNAGPHDWINERTNRLVDVLADEVLPHSTGCQHVVQFIHGVVAIVCSDLHATWR